MNAATTIKLFGAYAIGAGLLLMSAPGLLLAPLGLAVPQEPWVRVLGVLALVLGAYYFAMGRAGATAFFRATLWGRPLFAALCGALVLADLAPWQLLVFGAVDLAGAGWTALALRKESA